jgi:hypothetical protein
MNATSTDRRNLRLNAQSLSLAANLNCWVNMASETKGSAR